MEPPPFIPKRERRYVSLLRNIFFFLAIYNDDRIHQHNRAFFHFIPYVMHFFFIYLFSPPPSQYANRPLRKGRQRKKNMRESHEEIALSMSTWMDVYNIPLFKIIDAEFSITHLSCGNVRFLLFAILCVCALYGRSRFRPIQARLSFQLDNRLL